MLAAKLADLGLNPDEAMDSEEDDGSSKDEVLDKTDALVPRDAADKPVTDASASVGTHQPTAPTDQQPLRPGDAEPVS